MLIMFPYKSYKLNLANRFFTISFYSQSLKTVFLVKTHSNTQRYNRTFISNCHFSIFLNILNVFFNRNLIFFNRNKALSMRKQKADQKMEVLIIDFFDLSVIIIVLLNSPSSV